MEEDIDEIILAGGGDNGLLTALLLKKFNPDIEITVIDDLDADSPEIGKSTIVYILKTLHNVLDIDERRFLSEVRPVWKASIYFEDWCGTGPFHIPFDEYEGLDSSSPGEYYYRYEQNAYHTLGCELVEQRKTPFSQDMTDVFSQVAYHFPVHRFNRFLREVCRERGIELVNDTITGVETRENRIERITGESGEYEADLYIDATGFNRDLMRRLDSEFRPFGYPIDSALFTRTEIEPAEIVPATVVRSGDHGWFWQIDTLDRRDLGYVHSSSHVSTEEATREFETFIEERDPDAEIRRSDIDRISWTAGRYEKAWVNNCVAIGNTLGFLEPLQSTSFTLNALLTERLAQLLQEHQQLNHGGVRQLYNEIVDKFWSNVYDFVSCHYKYAAGTNDFWTAMRSIDASETLERIVADYQQNGFNSHELFGVKNELSLIIFDQHLFYVLLRNLGVESEFYERNDIEVGPDVATTVDAERETLRNEAATYRSYEDLVQAGFFE